MLGVILSIVFAILLIKTKGETRLVLFFAAVFFIPSYVTIISKPQLPAHRLFLLSFFISIWYHKELKGRFPLDKLFIVYFFTLLLINFQSGYLTTFYKAYKPLVFFLDSYFAIIVGYYGLRQCDLMNRKIVIILTAVFVYGIFTYFTGADPFRIVFPQDVDIMEEYLFGGRKRIMSTWSHPIPYVFICAVMFYLLVRMKSVWKYPALLCATFTIIFGGTRTALLSWVFMGAIILALGMSLKKYSTFLVSLLVIVVPLIAFVPEAQDKFSDLYYSMIGDENKVQSEGSSMEMRDAQMAGAIAITSQFPLTGGGIDYIQEQLIRGDIKTSNFTDENMLGFESYLYSLMIERGILGMVLEAFMLLSLVFFFIKHRKGKMDAAYGIAFTLGFYLFAIITGAMNAWMFPMLYAGACAWRCVSEEEPSEVKARGE